MPKKRSSKKTHKKKQTGGNVSAAAANLTPEQGQGAHCSEQNDNPVSEATKKMEDLTVNSEENDGGCDISLETSATSQGSAPAECVKESKERAEGLKDAARFTDNQIRDTTKASPRPPGKVPLETSTRNGSKKTRLQELLTGEDKGELDSSYYPVLVLNTPSNQYTTDDLEKKLGFIAKINWNAVFDSNADSNLNGLCYFVKGNSKHSSRILSPDKFVETENISDVREGIGFPEETAWVFCNGRHDIEEKKVDKFNDKDWTKFRLDAVQRTVQFFANPKVIPEDRAVVIFLLLSDEGFKVLSQIFLQFYISKSFNLHNFTIIATDREIIDKFLNRLEQIDVDDREEIESRCFEGHSWEEINEYMTLISGAGESQSVKLPKFPHGSCNLSRSRQRQWPDLTILGKNECQHSARNQDEAQYRAFAADKEMKFYQGHEVDWWNFQLTEEGFNHVLERQHHNKLKSEVKRALKYDGQVMDDIPLVSVFHEACAGGTTLAKHVLWDIHKEYRCAVVNRITKDTVNQIVAFWNHGYSNESLGPVVLLLDNVSSETLGDLMKDLEKKKISSSPATSVPFVFLHCRRMTDPENLHKNPCVPVTHKLSREEQKWFKKKTEDLEEREVFSEKDSPERLLGFMVLKSQCDRDYLRNVVKRIRPEEVKLLKYCTLL